MIKVVGRGWSLSGIQKQAECDMHFEVGFPQVNRRLRLFKIIFNNDAYISTLTITNLFLNDITPDEKNTFSIQNKIIIDLLNFREEAKLSKSILLYFTIYFLSIFEYKFSDSKTITKFEYNDLIHNLTNLKESTFK